MALLMSYRYIISRIMDRKYITVNNYFLLLRAESLYYSIGTITLSFKGFNIEKQKASTAAALFNPF